MAETTCAGHVAAEDLRACGRHPVSETTEAAVEAAARALLEGHGYVWERETEAIRNTYRADAHRALTAAAQVQPVVEADERDAMAYAMCSAPTQDVIGPDNTSLRVHADIHDAYRMADLALTAGFRRSQPAPRTPVVEADVRREALRDALDAVERVSSWSTSDTTALTNAGNAVRALIRAVEVPRV